MLTSISNRDFQKFLNKYSIKQGVEASSVCDVAENILKKTLPIFKGKVLSYKNNNLIVVVDNSILAYELKLKESQILNFFELNKIKLNKIIYRVGLNGI